MKTRTRRRRVLPPIHPNDGLRVEYQQRLLKLLEEMQRSLEWWIGVQWKKTPPVMAQDDVAAVPQLSREMQELSRRWESRFSKLAPKLASYFTTQAAKRSDDRLAKILRDTGFTVDFRVTPEIRDMLDGVVQQNVSLIKSIAQQHLSAVEGHVMRSVVEGRKLDDLYKALREQFGVAQRRAKLIALHQNNMATAAITRARQMDAGITEAIWVHSHGSKHPRPTHIANDGKRYDTSKGWFDPDVRQWILPGQLIGCRCFSRPVIEGF